MDGFDSPLRWRRVGKVKLRAAVRGEHIFDVFLECLDEVGRLSLRHVGLLDARGGELFLVLDDVEEQGQYEG